MYTTTTHFVLSSDELGLDNLVIEASYLTHYWEVGLLSGRYLQGIYRCGKFLQGLSALDYLVDTLPRGVIYSPVFQDYLSECEKGLFILAVKTETASFYVERDFVLDILEYRVNTDYLEREIAEQLFPLLQLS